MSPDGPRSTPQRFKASPVNFPPNLNLRATFRVTNVSLSVHISEEASHRPREENDMATHSSATACRGQNTPNGVPSWERGWHSACQLCRVAVCHLLSLGGSEFPDLLPKRTRVAEPTQSHIRIFTWMGKCQNQSLSWDSQGRILGTSAGHVCL